MTPALAFELRPGEGDIGMWQIAGAPVAPVAPVAPAGDDAGTASWRCDVASIGDLRALRRRVDRTANDLPVAATRLTRAVGDAGPAVAFGTPGAPPVEGAAERELVTWLDGGAGDGAVAFGVGDDAGWSAQAMQELATLLDRLRSWIAPTALVRTSSGDVAVAVTALRWAGRTTTAVAAGAGAPELRLHHDVVELVAASRRAVVRVAGLAAEGVVRIGSRLALPGGPLIALPATWRFVHRVVDEMEGARR